MIREVHNIDIFDITKEFVDKMSPFIHSDKNGFLLCKQGHIQLSLDNNVFDINSGDLYIYPSFSQTFIKEVSEDFFGVVGIADFDFVISTITPVSNTRQQIYIRSRPCVTLTQGQLNCIEEIIGVIKRRLAESDRPLGLQILSTLAQTMCLEILDAYFAGLSINPLLQNRKDKIFQKFLQDCFRHYKKHKDVKFYAELQNLTPRHFSTVIHEISGKTPIEWLEVSVINEAKKMLADPNLSIKEIARQLNFNDQSLFGRYFKNKVGVSPKKFREQ